MPIWPDNWAKILIPDIPLIELIARISIVYLFLFFLLRVMLKRESGGMGISDLLVVVLVADVAQSGMAGEYTAVGEALILASTLVFWDWALSYLAYHQPWFARLIRPRPLLLVQDGKLLQANTRREFLTREEIEEQLRLQGIESIGQVSNLAFISVRAWQNTCELGVFACATRSRIQRVSG